MRASYECVKYFLISLINVVQIQRKNTNNFLNFKFDDMSIHFNAKAITTQVGSAEHKFAICGAWVRERKQILC